MNFDEETFLSAYLDGALDIEQRRRVESSLVSDPRLADHLRSLTAVRDLVAGLSRPGPAADVSALILNRIQERPVLGSLRRFRDSARSPRALLAILSTAALAFAAVSLAFVAAQAFRAHRPVRAGDGAVARFTPADSGERPPLSVAVSAPHSPASTTTPKLAGPQAPPPAAATLHGPDPAERLGDAELQKVRRILDSPSLRKVFVVADVLGGQATRQVGNLLDTTPRKYSTYICITIDPNVAVDPKHPGGASVFAVVLDDQELGRLRVALRDEFHGNLEETDPNPQSVTQLADSGQVGVFPGTTVADLILPVDAPLSLRSAPEKALIPVIPKRSPSRSFTENPDASIADGDANLALALAGLNAVPPSTDQAGSRDNQIAAPPASSRLGPRRPASVVLVWVTRPISVP